MSKKIKVGTHNGVFHADEVTSISLLKLFLEEDIEIIRTRDEEELETCDILVDVGNKYDGCHYFDHHQAEFNGEINEVKASSAGLILLWLKNEEKISEGMFKHLHEKVVKGVDANDNGIETLQGGDYSISQIVSQFNPNWDEAKSEDTAFQEAVEFAKGVLQREVNSFKSKRKASSIVKKAVEEAKEEGRAYAILDKFVPWQETLIAEDEEENLKYLLYPTKGGDFAIRTIPVEVGSFEARVDLPESWAVGNDVSIINSELGVDDTVFSHVNRFFACWKTKKSAVKAAEYLT